MHVDDHFVVLDENGLLQLIKADHEQMVVVSEINLEQPAPDQAALGQTAMGKPYWAAPILSHGLLFVRGAQHVACFEIIGDD